ncbi:Uncharacterised protein [Mycobacteroides abscessus subsp. abscessus]|nr:Uncharacterised protein [Mycobacteroides abscessus subsp. abscessus]SIJ11643.1 Uncharacterised protein [Mycobacteroides abscessus subsp. abscessus]
MHVVLLLSRSLRKPLDVNFYSVLQLTIAER